MKTSEKHELEDCIQILKSFQRSIEAEENYLLEFHWDEKERRAYWEGNSVGLLHLICRLLDLCKKDFDGAHIHLDEHSDFPEGSNSLTVFKR